MSYEERATSLDDMTTTKIYEISELLGKTRVDETKSLGLRRNIEMTKVSNEFFAER